MYNRNVKINENMLEYDLEGNVGDWGYFIDPSDTKRKNLYNQPKPKITTRYRFLPIIEENEEDIYINEESDYTTNIVYKISTIGILLNTIYIIYIIHSQ